MVPWVNWIEDLCVSVYKWGSASAELHRHGKGHCEWTNPAVLLDIRFVCMCVLGGGALLQIKLHNHYSHISDPLQT